MAIPCGDTCVQANYVYTMDQAWVRTAGEDRTPVVSTAVRCRRDGLCSSSAARFGAPGVPMNGVAVAGETIITVVGNLTADPELRYTPSGVAVVTFTVASNTRNFDRDSGSWKDGATLFLRCSAWRRLAENIGESGLRRGMGVMVRGRLESHTYDSKDGERRTSVELTAEDVGASLGRSAATGLRIQGSGVQGDPATTLSNEDR